MSKKIGRFELRKELGRGAQSTVYLGFDPQLQREIAIKTVHVSRADPTQNQVLLDEARTVSKLRHPNIVPIFEAGEADGDIYLVFEYVPGKNLAEFLRDSGALSPVKAIGIMRPILDAVAHAHAQSIIHRDLKPSNILLDENGTPRVMDFGIAARVDSPSDDTQEYSGTPAYMAPEYIENRQTSERSDVFAAGLILFEMLAGRRAVEGNNVFQVMHRLANENLKLPASAAVDDALGGILYKALARDPGCAISPQNSSPRRSITISIRKRTAKGGKARSRPSIFCSAGCATRAIFRPSRNRSVRSTRLPTARPRASPSSPIRSSRTSR
ncbi:serine/threonine-protein kinase [Dechloromonas sp. A34]|uniref:serine/threonine-protein kinase n=1 Tax=Dechloromonas sp. A34 TaxID=447588 RepID=UPI002248D482|nr:serine/threonine-protein kinase [Dechloromonas sp. A34]